MDLSASKYQKAHGTSALLLYQVKSKLKTSSVDNRELNLGYFVELLAVPDQHVRRMALEGLHHNLNYLTDLKTEKPDIVAIYDDLLREFRSSEDISRILGNNMYDVIWLLLRVLRRLSMLRLILLLDESTHENEQLLMFQIKVKSLLRIVSFFRDISYLHRAEYAAISGIVDDISMILKRKQTQRAVLEHLVQAVESGRSDVIQHRLQYSTLTEHLAVLSYSSSLLSNALEDNHSMHASGFRFVLERTLLKVREEKWKDVKLLKRCVMSEMIAASLQTTARIGMYIKVKVCLEYIHTCILSAHPSTCTSCLVIIFLIHVPFCSRSSLEK